MKPISAALCGLMAACGDTLESEPTESKALTEDLTHTVEMSVTLNAGEEDTQCLDVTLPNTQELAVFRVETTLSALSHHLVIYKSQAETADPKPEPYHCFPFSGALIGEATPMLGSQVRVDALELPAGVAYSFAPNQVVRLEMHAINTGTIAAPSEATVKFIGRAKQDVKYYADQLFYGTLDLHVPAQQVTTVGPLWLPVDPTIKVFALAGHTHRYGIDVTASRSTSATDSGTPLYQLDDWQWKSSPTMLFDPPIEFAKGEGLRFSCIFDNTGTQDVGFGKSANDEMCFLFGYYYPAAGYRLCFEDDGKASCCNGDDIGSCL